LRLFPEIEGRSDEDLHYNEGLAGAVLGEKLYPIAMP